MSRIYVVSHKSGFTARYVRAATLNGAIRALAGEIFTARAASAEDIVGASKDGEFSVLDALAAPDDAADPGPVPQRAAEA